MGVYRRRYRDEKGVLRSSRYFYCTDPRTGRPRSLRVTDEKIAAMRWGDLLRQHELRLAGVDMHDDTRSAKPTALLELWIREKQRLNRDARYVDQLEAHVRAFLSRVSSIVDLTPARIEALLPVIVDEAEERRRAQRPGAKRHRMGPRTANSYLVSLHGFFAWLVRTKRWDANPVAGVERAKVKGQAAPERWALTREQLTALVDPDQAVPLWRAVTYLLAATTGLRRSELAQVLEADVDLERATIRARARMTKDSEDETLPLPAWTVELLRLYLHAIPRDFVPVGRGRRQPRGERLLLHVPQVETLRRDLERVGIAPTNAAGDVFDFHSLRVSCATILAREGVGLQLVSRIMRHSDVRLTQHIYTRLVLHDTRAAVSVFEPAPEPARGPVPERADAQPEPAAGPERPERRRGSAG